MQSLCLTCTSECFPLYLYHRFLQNKNCLTSSRRRKIPAAGRKETSFPYSSGFQGVTFTVQEGQTF